jgi:probable F420-dependent oxidoreductase
MVHDRRFRFGVICPGTGIADAKAFTDLARKCEDLGYSALFVPDHFVEHPFSPTVALAHAAAVTAELRIGPLVLGNDYRHPVVLARDMATLDLLSHGRLELGIGAGWMTADYEKAGLRHDPPGVRIERLAEAVAILKGLFAPGEFTFTGAHYEVRALDGMPKPVQQPVPFLIGGGGPRILALAAREAAIVGINANLRSGEGQSADAISSLTATATDEKVARLRAAASTRFDDLELQTLVGFTHVTDDPAPIIEGMAGHFGVTPDDARMSPVTLVGSHAEMEDLLEARRERWQISYPVVGAERIDAFAPVVARLRGH